MESRCQTDTTGASRNEGQEKKMTTITYRIAFSNNAGSRAAESLAFSCGGSWGNAVQRFDGEHDMAFIECPAENAGHLERMMEDDDNVISYAEH